MKALVVVDARGKPTIVQLENNLPRSNDTKAQIYQHKIKEEEHEQDTRDAKSDFFH
jgi:hypothetical protein